jgi:23S rRNA U2552 (ribose-2'-O)-methylase RlmE/FtsJ
MASLVQKVHFCFRIHHEGFGWSDNATPPSEVNTNSNRILKFYHDMRILENELTTEKLKIEHVKKSLWDYYKKLVNPYEYVHLNKSVLPSTQTHGTQVTPAFAVASFVSLMSLVSVPEVSSTNSLSGTNGLSMSSYSLSNVGIANYEPISRAYFKMWEILHDFPIVSKKRQPIRYAALAEGPGGFIEAFIHFRRCYAFDIPIHRLTAENYTHSCGGGDDYTDSVVAVTLCDKKVQVPGWRRSQQFLNFYKKQVSVSYGSDGTGNLYNKENIDHYCDLFREEKADIVTADGGFDFSDNYSQQEYTLYRLFLAEVIIGLRVLKKGGNFVIKVFDFMTPYTVEMLYMICGLFRRVYITKPFTSRIMNSEKYIVACGYMCFDDVENVSPGTIDTYMHTKQMEIIRRIEHQFGKITDDIHAPNTTILRTTSIPIEFIHAVEQCNMGFGIRQLTSLVKTFDYIERQFGSDTIDQIKKDQCVYAIAWCKKYNYPIYYRSKVLKEIGMYHYIPIF